MQMKKIALIMLLGCGVAEAQLTSSSSNEEFLETARRYYAKEAELEKMAAEATANIAKSIVKNPDYTEEQKSELLQSMRESQIKAAKEKEAKRLEEEKLETLQKIEANQRKQLAADKEAAAKQLRATEDIRFTLDSQKKTDRPKDYIILSLD
jgi:hypothetical protein